MSTFVRLSPADSVRQADLRWVRARALLGHAWTGARDFAFPDEYALDEARYWCDVLVPPLRARLESALQGALPSRTLVDFGCGYAYPLLCALAPVVGRIVGVDVCPTHDRRAAPWLDWRGGPLAATRRISRHRITARLHRRIVERAGRPRDGESYATITYDGLRVPLRDGFADAVVSNAVLQELPLPLEPFAREIARLLKPGGYIDVEWHNFFAFSGNYGDHALRRSDPWGHLLDRPADPTLNRVQPDDVVAAFTPWFDGLRVLRHDRRYRIEGQDADYQPEGVEHLSADRAARLSRYPRSLLTTRGFVLVGRRRQGEPA